MIRFPSTVTRLAPSGYESMVTLTPGVVLFVTVVVVKLAGMVGIVVELALTAIV